METKNKRAFTLVQILVVVAVVAVIAVLVAVGIPQNQRIEDQTGDQNQKSLREEVPSPPAPVEARETEVRIRKNSLRVRDVIEESMFMGGDIFSLLGEVENTGPEWVKNVKITATFYDQRGFVQDQTMTFSKVGRLGPGQKSPFTLRLLSVEQEDGKHRPRADYDLEVSWETTRPSDWIGELVYEGVKILSAKLSPRELHRRIYPNVLEVELHNAGTLHVHFSILMTFYDDAGRVLYYDRRSETLLPNQVKTITEYPWRNGPWRGDIGEEFGKRISDYSILLYSFISMH